MSPAHTNRPTERHAPPEPLLAGGVIRPQDCAMILGIPTCEAEYIEELRNFVPRDFTRRACKSRVLFETQVERFAARFLPQFEELGVKLFRRGTLGSLGHAISGGAKVAIVFTHWQEKPPLIEFFDGMNSPAEVNAAIPRGFAGIIDWCICNPDLLALLHYENEAHLRVWRNRRITPGVWLCFFRIVFGLLNESPMTYVSSYSKALDIIKGNL